MDLQGWKEAARKIGPGIRVDVVEDAPHDQYDWRVGIPASRSGSITREFDLAYPDALEGQIGQAILDVREQALSGANAQERIDAAVMTERGRIAGWLAERARKEWELAAHALPRGVEENAKASARALESAASALLSGTP